VQKPHPPVYVAAVSPETYQWVIRNGYDVMTSFLDPYEKVFNLYKGYHVEAEKAGRAGQLDMPLARFVYVSETTEKAREEAREHLMWFLGTLLAEVMVPPPEVPLPGPSEVYQQLKEKYAAITFDEVLAEHAIVGDPDFVTDKLKWIEENTGTKHFMCWTRIGGLKHERVCKSLKMFAEHVMPQFED
jgi:alkanesulfonate monooxygenase SsuD/methylene tetrahydromethanopterin reductase-like flavin-dependent oxidoreductase (luciferase family)